MLLRYHKRVTFKRSQMWLQRIGTTRNVWSLRQNEYIRSVRHFPISKQFINIYINANSDNFCETKSVILEIQQNSWNFHLQNEANKEQLR